MVNQRGSRLTAFVVLFASIALPAVAQRAMTLVDVLNVGRISDPQLSPDGAQILYVLGRSDWKANKRITHIWRVQADGSGTVQMTDGAEGETSPRWSPDGKTIAFIAKRGDEANEIYLMPADGGEGRALTKHATAASRIAWSPDGSAIYFTAPEEKTQEEKDKDKAKDDVFAFDEDYKQLHLWKVSVGDRREQRITSGDYAINDFELTRDGKRVVIQRAPNPLYGYSDEGEVWIMNVDGSGAVQLTKNHVPEDGGQASPDGSEVLFLSQSNEKFEPYFNRKIFLVGLERWCGASADGESSLRGGPRRLVEGRTRDLFPRQHGCARGAVPARCRDREVDPADRRAAHGHQLVVLSDCRSPRLLD